MLTRDDIFSGLKRIGELAREEGMTVDIAVFGGSAIAMTWQFRVATRDVDAVVIKAKDKAFLNRAGKLIAEEKGWETDWLNDGVKGFIGEVQDFNEYPLAPNDDNPGIRVYTPTPEYMLALKCMAMRIDDPDGASDIEDIKHLLEILDVNGTDEVMDIVEHYFPKGRVSAKVQFGIEEIIGSLQEQKDEPQTHKPG